jgi:hypothetical protein
LNRSLHWFVTVAASILPGSSLEDGWRTVNNPPRDAGENHVTFQLKKSTGSVCPCYDQQRKLTGHLTLTRLVELYWLSHEERSRLVVQNNDHERLDNIRVALDGSLASQLMVFTRVIEIHP